MVRYDELKVLARRVRFELTARGIIDAARPKRRRKPRDPEKLDALYQMARARLDRYPSHRTPEGRMVLPYFKDYFAERFPGIFDR